MSNDLLPLLQGGFFLLSLWAGSQVFGYLQCALIGEIVVGLILGPELLNIVPYHEAWILLGDIGLVLLVFEGGLSIDPEALRKVGIRAFIIAFAGTIIPLLTGFVLFIAFGFDGVEALAAGTTLSSTSIGMATRMLKQENQLHTKLGCLITVSAMVDDILSLIILGMISNASNASNQNAFATTGGILLPLVSAVVIIVLATILAIIAPRLFRLLKTKVSTVNYYKLVLLSEFSLLYVATMAAGYSGTTHLLGAFSTGVIFSTVPQASWLFEEHRQPADWLGMVFFGAIGFVIPLKQMFIPAGLGLGLIYTVPAIVGKLVTGLCASTSFLEMNAVGWAMVGRGELGFVMAATAIDNAVMTELGFAICVWALLLATIASPFMFKISLALISSGSNKSHKGHEKLEEDPETGNGGNTPKPISMESMDASVGDDDSVVVAKSMSVSEETRVVRDGSQFEFHDPQAPSEERNLEALHPLGHRKPPTLKAKSSDKLLDRPSKVQEEGDISEKACLSPSRNGDKSSSTLNRLGHMHTPIAVEDIPVINDGQM